MNIIITGCLGHIGSYLIHNLYKIKKVKNIYLVDNNSNNKISTLFNLKIKNKKIYFIYDNLMQPKKFFKIKNIHVLIHLASITDAQNSIGEKKFYEKNNLGCFNNVLKYCILNKTKLIHISSTSIYGDQSKIVNENSKFLKPQSPYAEIKLKEEKILKKNSKKIKFISLRFGTIAGVSRGMRFHTAVNKFCLNTILNENVPIWKTALNQYRPYLSLTDAFKTFQFILENDFFKNDIFNVLSENKTVKEILSIIKKLGYQPKIYLTNSKIMNQLSYKVQKNKIEKHGLKLNAKIKKDIHETLKILKEVKNVRF